MKRKGSMTIYAALTIMLVAAFLFALLEAARMEQLQIIANVNTESVTESLFAAYSLPLWENYKILGFDKIGRKDTDNFSVQTSQLWSLSEDNLNTTKFGRNNFLKLKVSEASIDQYKLLTDDEGDAFISVVAAYMENNIAQEAISLIYDYYNDCNGLEQNEQPVSDPITGAEDAIAKAKQEREAAQEAERKAAEEARKQAIKEGKVLPEKEQPKEEESSAQLEENPLEIVKEIWTKGTLSLVVKEMTNVSNRQIDLSKVVSTRPIEEGTKEENLNPDIKQRALFETYLLSNFGCYRKAADNKVLSYELEYILCGKDSDMENLKGTVDRILAMREAANLAYLATDPAKQGQALEIATALAGATANPLIVEAVKYGVLTAWAFAESILDIRALLNGKKIAVMKNAGNWTTDIFHLSSAFSSFGEAVESPNGMNYEQYVGMLLLLEKEKKAAFRTMDLMESNIRTIEGYSSFCMDDMAVDATIHITYEYNTIFLGMEKITKGNKRNYSITTSHEYSYRKAGV